MLFHAVSLFVVRASGELVLGVETRIDDGSFLALDLIFALRVPKLQSYRRPSSIIVHPFAIFESISKKIQTAVHPCIPVYHENVIFALYISLPLEIFSSIPKLEV